MSPAWLSLTLEVCYSSAPPFVIRLTGTPFSAARFSIKDSDFNGVDAKSDIAQLIITFFSVDYLDILISYSLHVFLGASGGSESIEYYSEDWGSTSEGELDEFARKRGYAMLWIERIQRMTLRSELDQVIVLSEESINKVLRRRLEYISSFDRGNKLPSLKILDLKVRLLSSGKAVLYMHVEGQMAIRT